MAKQYPPIEKKWSYRQMARFTKMSKTQAARDCKEAQKKIDNNDEDFVFHLSAILRDLSTIAVRRTLKFEANGT